MRVAEIRIQVGRERVGRLVAEFAPGGGTVGEGLAEGLGGERILRLELPVQRALSQSGRPADLSDAGAAEISRHCPWSDDPAGLCHRFGDERA